MLLNARIKNLTRLIYDELQLILDREKRGLVLSFILFCPDAGPTPTI